MLFGVDPYLFGFIVSLLALCTAGFLYWLLIFRTASGGKVMLEIANDVRDMANVFTAKMDTVIFSVTFIISCIIAIFDFWSGVACLTGCGVTILASIIGMKAGTHTSHRVTHSADQNKKQVGPPLRIAFLGSSVMAMAVIGLISLGITSIVLITKTTEFTKTLFYISSFAMGSSIVALFSKNGGGFFSKGMDMAADLSGKVIAGLPEDDPMNPASKGDNAGDYACDIKGTGTDMGNSYATMLYGGLAICYLVSPLLAGMIVAFTSLGIIATTIGITIMLKVNIRKNASLALSLAVYGTYLIFAILSGLLFILTKLPWQFFIALLTGPLVSGVIIGISTNIFTGGKPVEETAENGKMSTAHATTSSIEAGHAGTIFPIASLVITILISYYLCGQIPGMYSGIAGIAIAVVGLGANMGINVGIDVFGPIADNAKGLAEMSGLSEDTIITLDEIDATGNYTAAYAKGIAIGMAGLSSVSLVIALVELIKRKINVAIDLNDTTVLVKILVGGFMGIISSATFVALTLRPPRKIAFKVMEFIAEQFKIMPLAKRKETNTYPDHKGCAEIAANYSLLSLPLPVLIIIAINVAVKFIPGLGSIALIGFMASSTFLNLFIGLWMSIAGGNADNAKKFCESGSMGPEHSKGSQTHKNLIQNDTIGDSLKDVTGPGANSLNETLALISMQLTQLSSW